VLSPKSLLHSATWRSTNGDYPQEKHEKIELTEKREADIKDIKEDDEI